MLKSSKMNISANNFAIKFPRKKRKSQKRKMKVFSKNLHKIRVLQIFSQKFPIRLKYSLGISPLVKISACKI